MLPLSLVCAQRRMPWSAVRVVMITCKGVSQGVAVGLSSCIFWKLGLTRVNRFTSRASRFQSKNLGDI